MTRNYLQDDVLKHVLEHTYQIAIMATNWDWHTCRKWSETVFTMIADGRLPQGWDDAYAIKDVQRDVCTLGMSLEKSKTGKPKVLQKLEPPMIAIILNTTGTQMENPVWPRIDLAR